MKVHTGHNALINDSRDSSNSDLVQLINSWAEPLNLKASVYTATWKTKVALICNYSYIKSDTDLGIEVSCNTMLQGFTREIIWNIEIQKQQNTWPIKLIELTFVLHFDS